MDADLRRCIRCKGRKKMYKVGGAYSFTNTGGVEVKCPMCLGEGSIKKLEKAVSDNKASVRKIKSAPKRGNISRQKIQEAVESISSSRDLADGREEEIQRA